jgi:CheY-like chemotaxis protein
MKPPTPILVIDDDRTTCDEARVALVEAGYGPISEAGDGVEALQILRQSDVPMVVLSDYRMPRMDGLRLLDALTSGGPELSRHRFILMIANVRLLSPAQQQFLLQQRVPIVRKPFEFERLLDAVEEAFIYLQHAAAVAGTR